MHRFFVDGRGIENGTAYLAPAEAEHALRVLRLKPGDEVALLDGLKIYRAVIADVGNGQVRCQVTEELPSPETNLRITLYQGLPKADKLEWIVQKCTEAGVAGIFPVSFSRSVAQVSKKDAPKKLERWQRIAMEAAKQAGRAAVPAVGPPLTLDQALAAIKGHELAVAPWEEAGSFGPLAVHEKYSHVRDVAVVIGPEGGIDPKEMALLQKEAGAVPMTMGRRIFRTETAGLAAAVALFALWGDME